MSIAIIALAAIFGLYGNCILIIPILLDDQTGSIQQFSPQFILGIGFVTFLAYAFPYWRQTWYVFNHKPLIAFIAVVFILLKGWYLFNIDEIKILIFILPVYLIYMAPWNKKWSLRNQIFLKPIAISLCWTYIVYALPVYYCGLKYNLDLLLNGAEYFILYLCMSLIVDIHDRDLDLKAGFNTLATKFTPNHLIWLIISLLILSLLPLVFYTNNNNHLIGQGHLIAALILFLIFGLGIHFPRLRFLFLVCDIVIVFKAIWLLYFYSALH